MSLLSPLRPEGDHDRLLRAALLDGPVARAEFEAWRRDRDLEALDPGSTRLLPLVARNLRGALRSDDRFERRVAAVARAAWLKAQTVVARARPLFAALGGAGVTPILVKGWAVAPAYGGDTRLRPMDDLDFYVPRQSRSLAWSLLLEQGFRPAEGLQETHGALDRRIGWNFSAGGAADVDLHWHFLEAAPREEIDRQIARDASPADLAGVACRALAPEDALLSTVLHAARWEPVPSLRWAADAVLLVRARGGDFDWQRLVERARAAHAEVALAAALDYLARRLELPVPSAARRRLSRPPLWRRLEHRAAILPAPLRSSAGRWALTVGAELRRSAASGDRIGDGAALAALARRLDLRSPLFLPSALLFAVRGRPWRWRRWLSPPRPVEPPAAPELPEAGLELGLRGAHFAGLGVGWSWSEPEGRWTDGPEAVVRFRLPPERLPAALELVLVPYLAPGSRGRRLEVLFDGRPIGTADWRGTELHRRQLRFELPTLAPLPSAHELRLVVRDPCSPHAAGDGFDARELGVFVERLRLDWAAEGGRVDSAARGNRP